MFTNGTKVKFWTPKGWEKAIVVKDTTHDDGRVEVTILGGDKVVKRPDELVKCDWPVIKDRKTPMDEYTVQKYKAIESLSEETRAFTAVIYRNGVRALLALNRGTGGANKYTSLQKGAHADFYLAAHVWAKTLFPQVEPIEPMDLWVEWYQNVRPFGVNGEMFLTAIYTYD